MSRRIAHRASRKRRLPAVHAAIEAQAAAMWARFNETGNVATPDEYPGVTALYRFAVAKWNRTPAPHGRYFTYLGRRYVWESTNLGRLRVLSPETGVVLAIGGPFVVK